MREIKMKFYFILLFSITVLNANAVDELLLDIRAKQLKLIEKKNHESITYYTAKKDKIRKRVVYDDKNRVILNERYSYNSGCLENKVVYEYDKNSTKKSKPSIVVEIEYDSYGHPYLERKRFVKHSNGMLDYDKYYEKNGRKRIYYYLKSKNRSKTVKLVVKDKNDETVEVVEYGEYKDILYRYKNKKLISKEEYSDYDEGKRDGKSIYYDENETIREIDYYDDGSFLFNAHCSFDIQYYMDTLEQGKYSERSEKYEKFGATCYEFDKNRVVILSLYNKKKMDNRTTLWLVVVDPEKKEIKEEFFYTSKSLYDIENYRLTNSTYRSKIDKNVIDLVGDIRVGRYEYDRVYESFNIQKNRVLILAQPTFDMKTIEEELESKTVRVNLIEGMLFEEPISKKNIDIYRNIVALLERKGNHKSKKFLEIKLNNFLMFSDDEFQLYAVEKRGDGQFHALLQKGFGRNYRTRLKKALAKNKVDFAGKYVVAQWGGCDEGKNNCQTGGIVDTLTGVATPLPFKNYTHNSKNAFYYRANSSLMVVAGDFEFADGTKSSNEIRTYSMSNGVLELLKTSTFIFEENTKKKK